MQVTLYSQDKLNISYTGVFYNQELLNGYLNGITVKYNFALSDFYPLFNDTVFLTGYADNLVELVQLNYMKFTPEETDENKNTFYAFIDEIEARNDGFMISYTIDIYHSFLPDTGYTLTHSVLGATRYPEQYKSDLKYKLPVGYKTENVNIMRIDDTYGMSLIAQVQFYNTVEAGVVPQVETYMVGVGHLIRNADGSLSFSDKLETFGEGEFDIPLNAISEKMTTLQNWCKSDPEGLIEVTRNAYYRILNIYAVPASFLYNRSILNKDYIILKNDVDTGWAFSFAVMKDFNGGVFSKTISKNFDFFKNKSVGVFTNLTPIDTALNKCTINLSLIIHETGFNCLLQVNNIVNDITNDLAVDLLYSVDDASALQVQKMNKTINENNAKQAKVKFVSSVIDTGLEAAQGYLGMATNAISGVGKIATGKIFSGVSQLGQAEKAGLKGVQNVKDAVVSAMGAKTAQKNSELRANQEFLNWQSELSVNKGFINAIFGLIITQDIANDEAIKLSISNYGYEIIDGYEINTIKDLTEVTGITEDYVKFNIANVMKLTGDYAETIKQILEKGVYVYYTS